MNIRGGHRWGLIRRKSSTRVEQADPRKSRSYLDNNVRDGDCDGELVGRRVPFPAVVGTIYSNISEVDKDGEEYQKGILWLCMVVVRVEPHKR